MGRCPPRDRRARVKTYVDASNVLGSRPDGWWRDRAGATRRLVWEIAAWAARVPDADVTVVLDAGEAPAEGIEVVTAPRRGRDAADDEIARRVAAEPDPAAVTVVTSDARLAERVRALGARVEGAGAFRRRLD